MTWAGGGAEDPYGAPQPSHDADGALRVRGTVEQPDDWRCTEYAKEAHKRKMRASYQEGEEDRMNGGISHQAFVNPDTQLLEHGVRQMVVEEAVPIRICVGARHVHQSHPRRQHADRRRAYADAIVCTPLRRPGWHCEVCTHAIGPQYRARDRHRTGQEVSP